MVQWSRIDRAVAELRRVGYYDVHSQAIGADGVVIDFEMPNASSILRRRRVNSAIVFEPPYVTEMVVRTPDFDDDVGFGTVKSIMEKALNATPYARGFETNVVEYGEFIEPHFEYVPDALPKFPLMEAVKEAGLLLDEFYANVEIVTGGIDRK